MEEVEEPKASSQDGVGVTRQQAGPSKALGLPKWGQSIAETLAVLHEESQRTQSKCEAWGFLSQVCGPMGEGWNPVSCTLKVDWQGHMTEGERDRWPLRSQGAEHGRDSSLPSLRPCAMVVPDFELICEIMLVAEGFLEARLLARKFITLYTLCKELLSKQVCSSGS